MSGYRRIMLVLGVLMAAGALACTLDFGAKEPSKPAVEVLSPLTGTRVAVGEEVAVEFHVADEGGVSRVELQADGVIVAEQRSDQAQTSMRAMLPWTPTAPGSHTLLVYAYNTDGVVSDAVGVTIVVVASEVTPTILPPLPTDTETVPEPPGPSQTVAPPAVAPPTATVSSAPPTPPSPTPTTGPAACPALRVILGPSQLRPYQTFGIQFERTGAIPAGHDYVVEFSVDSASWNRTEPIPARVRQDGVYWMAETSGPGEGTFYWHVCLVNMANPAGPAVCCTEPPHKIVHTR